MSYNPDWRATYKVVEIEALFNPKYVILKVWSWSIFAYLASMVKQSLIKQHGIN